jgi:hypothetical protein
MKSQVRGILTVPLNSTIATGTALLMSDAQADVANVTTGVGSKVTASVTDSTARVVQRVTVVKGSTNKDILSFAAPRAKSRKVKNPLKIDRPKMSTRERRPFRWKEAPQRLMKPKPRPEMTVCRLLTCGPIYIALNGGQNPAAARPAAKVHGLMWVNRMSGSRASELQATRGS